MKKILLLLLGLSAVVGASGAGGDGDRYSDDYLRMLIVENPDTVLAILDEAEAKHVASLPDYRISLLRGIAYNEKRQFSLVIHFASEALRSDSISHYPGEYLTALSMLQDAHYCCGNFSRSIEDAREAVRLAREVGNRPAELAALTTMAKTGFIMGDRNNGYVYIDEVISQAKGENSVNVLADISTAYGVKMVELFVDRRFDEALSAGYERLELIDKIDRLGGAPEGYTDQQRGYTYARNASSAYCAGRFEEAEKAYNDFLATEFSKNPFGRCFITSYLMESEQWDKVLEFTRPLYDMFEDGDTINDDYHSLLSSNAEAEYNLGNYRRGYDLLARAGAVRDSLYNRQMAGNVYEIAAAFALNEKDLQLAESKAQSQRKHILVLTISGIGLLIFVILLILWRQYKVALRHNRIASQQIDELLGQKERILALRCCNASADDADGSISEFELMEQKLWNDKVFVNPELNRGMLAEACGKSKARVFQLIYDNTGLTPNDYINKLRVEYSVKLMKEHPRWTVDAIAEASGYTRRATYYSNFKKVFGITPAQYRRDDTAGSRADREVPAGLD